MTMNYLRERIRQMRHEQQGQSTSVPMPVLIAGAAIGFACGLLVMLAVIGGMQSRDGCGLVDASAGACWLAFVAGPG